MEKELYIFEEELNQLSEILSEKIVRKGYKQDEIINSILNRKLKETNYQEDKENNIIYLPYVITNNEELIKIKYQGKIKDLKINNTSMLIEFKEKIKKKDIQKLKKIDKDLEIKCL